MIYKAEKYKGKDIKGIELIESKDENLKNTSMKIEKAVY